MTLDQLVATEARLEGRIDAAEGRIDGRFNAVEGRIGAVEAHLSRIDGRLDRLDGRIDGLTWRFGAAMAAQTLAIIGAVAALIRWFGGGAG